MKVWNIAMQAYGDLAIPGQAAHNRQVRIIVCANSQKRAVDLINATRFRFMTLGCFRTYGSETGNKIQLDTANGQEGVWWAPLDGAHRDMYKKAELR